MLDLYALQLQISEAAVKEIRVTQGSIPPLSLYPPDACGTGIGPGQQRSPVICRRSLEVDHRQWIDNPHTWTQCQAFRRTERRRLPRKPHLLDGASTPCLGAGPPSPGPNNPLYPAYCPVAWQIPGVSPEYTPYPILWPYGNHDSAVFSQGSLIPCPSSTDLYIS